MNGTYRCRSTARWSWSISPTSTASHPPKAHSPTARQNEHCRIELCDQLGNFRLHPAIARKTQVDYFAVKHPADNRHVRHTGS